MKYKYVYVPLEELDMRYTNHLNKDIERYLHNKNAWIVKPDLKKESSLNPSFFLDPTFTLKYKSMQLQLLMDYIDNNWIDDDAVIFFADLWFPGIEQLAYIKHFLCKRYRIRGIFHAGSWTDTDEVANFERWAHQFENMVLDITEKVFVGSYFMRMELIKKRIVNPDKVEFLRFNLDYDGMDDVEILPPNQRENIIVFNGRTHPEKQPWLLDTLRENLIDYDYKIVQTHKEQLSKKLYYELLGRAKVVVSFALQENFGYGVAEAYYLGCIPIVPDRLAYKEFYMRNYRYCDMYECVHKIKRALSGDMLYNYNGKFDRNKTIYNYYFG